MKLKHVKEALAYIDAEIRDLQTALDCVDNSSGLMGITMASIIANDIKNSIETLRFAWFEDNKNEVPND